jgi:tight adherence protein C
MLLAIFDFALIVPIAMFAAFGAGAWLVVDYLLYNKTRTEMRLEQMRTRRPGDPKSAVKATEGFARILEKASPTLAKPFQPKSVKETNKLAQRLSHAGFRHESAAASFLTLKTICMIAGIVVGGGGVALTMGLGINALIRVAGIGLLSLFIPDLILAFIAKKRKEKIFLSLPDALDLMVVCVEAGLGLDQAMRKVAEELRDSKPTIAYEFDVCNKQLQWGRPREEVLTDLGDRSGVDDLKALASIVVQADRFGSSIGQALRVQSDSMRTRRRQIAEEKAAKTAVKLIFPLVLFIFPGIFVVLVGPAAITMVNEMLPAFKK